MEYCIGTDIIEISRIEQAIEQWGERFLKRVYTDKELGLYRQDVASLAARFAGKEAVIKALSPPDGYLSWQNIEIVAEKNSKPVVNLYGKARERSQELGLKGFAISLSHCREYAMVFVMGVPENSL